MKKLFLIPLFLFLFGCSSDFGYWPEFGVYEGEISYGLEYRNFTPESFERMWFHKNSNKKEEESWWVKEGGSAEHFIALAHDEFSRKPDLHRVSTNARIKGKITKRGRFGHLGGWIREIEVVEIEFSPEFKFETLPGKNNTEE